MKFYPRLNQYKASNVIYDVNDHKAWSYDWYVLAKRFGDVMVVNKYSYSQTTIGHLYKIRKLFDSLSIKYVEIEAPRGLQDLDCAIAHHQELCRTIQAKLDNPRSRKHLKFARECLLSSYQERLGFILRLKQSEASQ